MKKRIQKALPPVPPTICATTPAPCVTRSVMLVTPEIADQFLEKNTCNRRVDRMAVTELAKAIVSGHWRVTHQGIAIGADGTLYDGQHRLLAVVEAKQSVFMEVTKGLSVADLRVIDIGGRGRRCAADVMGFTTGVTLTAARAAALNAAGQLIECGTLTGFRRATFENLESSYVLHSTALSELWPDDTRSPALRAVKSAPVLSALMIIWRSNPTQAVEFMGMLRSGASLHEGHAVLALRQHLSKVSTAGAAARDELSRRVFTAFAYFLQGRDVMRLHAGETARSTYITAWKCAKA